MTAICLMTLLLAANADEPVNVTVGSKAFTESAILGEMAGYLAQHHGYDVRQMKELGTRNLWSALLTGEIDVYAEYTGTMREEMFAGELLPDDESLRKKLAEHGIAMTAPLGFNNTYALGMNEDKAEELSITKISDLKNHPDLRLVFSSEFMNRADGWPSLQAKYELPQTQVRGLEHSLAYRAVDVGDADLTDVYSTDSNIKRYGMRVLADDRAHFPRYNALFIFRNDLVERAPKLIESLKQLEGTIDDARMLSLNQEVELMHAPEGQVAAEFLNQELGLQIGFQNTSIMGRIWKTTCEHLFLVITSLATAICVAVPLGVVAAKKPFVGQFIVGGAEIVQTIPGLALLIFLAVGFGYMSLPTIGPLPVIVALFFYSLLPIIRNTMTGLTDVSNSLKESAEALGLTPWAKLCSIELPMASRMILAGIKTTAVINVGYAALGGLIGAGGYGDPIMTGLRLNNESLMMEGAIPAAILALAVKLSFEYSERYLVPKGLRLEAAR